LQEADTLYELAQEEADRQPLAATSITSAGGGGRAAGWGRHSLASCIFESLPGHRCTPELRSDRAAYAEHRKRWPLRPGVCRLLLESQLTQLVVAVLGSGAMLFNDQVLKRLAGLALCGTW